MTSPPWNHLRLAIGTEVVLAAAAETAMQMILSREDSKSSREEYRDHAKLERSCGYEAKKIPPPIGAGGIVATATGALA